jgi:HSP20 family protein
MFPTKGFTSWDPWRELQRIHAEMDRLVQGTPALGGGEVPAVDVWADDDTLCVRALVPGLAREDLEVSVDGDALTIRGSLPAQSLGEGETWHRRERDTGRFTRTLQLPWLVDAERVQARCKDGVLEIDLPRSAADKPKRIPVAAS